MDFKQLKRLCLISDHELTAKLVKLFQIIDKAHIEFKGFSRFSWRNLEMTSEGELKIIDITEEPLTDEIKEQNYHDYAAIIYCICTKRKSDEFMTWDAGRKIKPVVLREIVLTFCGRNHSVEPLIRKLNKPYIDEETFFKGYSTVDEKEVTEAFEKEQTFKRNQYIGEQEFLREQEERNHRRNQKRFWGISGSSIAVFFAIGVFRACFHGASPTDIFNISSKNNIKAVMHSGSSLPHNYPTVINRYQQRILHLSDSLKSVASKMGEMDSKRRRFLADLERITAMSMELTSRDNLSETIDMMKRDSIALSEIETEINALSGTVSEPDSVTDNSTISYEN